MSKKPDVEEIARTVAAAAKPGMKPKELLDAVRRQHPEASRKQVSRAAFYAAILASESAPDTVPVVHDLAISSHSPDPTSGVSEPQVAPRRTRKRAKQFPSYPRAG
jgi:molybdenum cofactor biosynthesis enzyme